MSNKSMIDHAYAVLEKSKEPIAFRDLFSKVVAEGGYELSESEARAKMSSLYTQLSLDGRFLILTNNTWDLSSRHVFDQKHIDMEEAYSDVEEGEEYDAEEAELLREELGEEEEKEEPESDDLDFDKVKTNTDSEEDF